MTEAFDVEDPYPYYAWLRETKPVYRTEHGRWMITRHADAILLLEDGRCDHWGQQAPADPAQAALAGVLRALAPGANTFRQPMAEVLREHLDRDELARLARSTMEALRGSRHVDLITGFAHPFTFAAIARILGVPEEEIPELSRIVARLDGRYLQDAGQLKDALQVLLRRAPGISLAGRVAKMERFNVDSMVDLLLVVCYAGHQNMMNFIGLAALALARNPAKFSALHAAPDVIPHAVLELMRYDGPLQFIPLVARESILLRDTTIAAGDEILVAVGAANRDPEVFRDPDSLDWSRRPSQQLSFGGGPYRCVGAQLAVIEGGAALSALAASIAEFEVTPGPLAWRATPMVQRGLHSLPLEVRWNE